MSKIVKLTTETGSVYEMDVEGRSYKKNGLRDSLVTFSATPDWRPVYDSGKSFDPHLWAARGGWDSVMPKVGQCLYVAGFKSGWHLSSKIVSVEEVEEA